MTTPATPATRPPLTLRMHERDNVANDGGLRAGTIADGSACIEQVGWERLNLMLDVASGRKQTWAEHGKLHKALVLFNPAAVT